ncbi:MAG: MFS transporter [Alphaproteobacteria bacterium]|nr:MFS transporter [Alphaproteobacteria bacterium]
MTAAPARFNTYGWIIVAIGFFAVGMVYALRSSLGFMMPFWEEELGWQRTTISTTGALLLGVMAVASPVAGNLLDRYGPRMVVTGGLVLAALAAMLTAALVSDWQLLFAFGLLVGGACGAISIPMVAATAARYFDRHRGLATGVASSGSTGGQLLALPGIAILFEAVGWRGGFVTLGLLCVGGAVLAWWLIHNVADRTLAGAGAGVNAADDTLAARLRLLFTDRIYLLVFFAFTLCGFTTAGIIDVHLLPYAAACGFAPIESTTAYGVHGLFNMVGLIMGGWLADRWHRARLLASIFFLRGVTFVILLHVAGDLPLFFVFSALFGLLNFSAFPVIANIVASHFGLRVLGLSMGLVFGGHSFGAAAGAILGGYVSEHWGGYEWLWIIGAAAALIAAVLSILVGEKRGRPAAPIPAAA